MGLRFESRSSPNFILFTYLFSGFNFTAAQDMCITAMAIRVLTSFQIDGL